MENANNLRPGVNRVITNKDFIMSNMEEDKEELKQ